MFELKKRTERGGNEAAGTALRRGRRARKYAGRRPGSGTTKARRGVIDGPAFGIASGASCPIRAVAALGPDAVEALGEAAFFLEGGGLGGELAVQRATRHGDEREGAVGGDLGVGGRGGLHGRSGLGGPRRRLGATWSRESRFSSTHVSGPGGHGVGGGGAARDKLRPAWVFAGPEREGALTEEVFVVEPEFFEAGAGYVGEFEFGFLGGAAGLAAFGDVLHAGTRGLDHLVVGAAALFEVAVAETDGHVVRKLGDLETLHSPLKNYGYCCFARNGPTTRRDEGAYP